MSSVTCILICRLVRERGNRRNGNFSAVKNFRWFAVKYAADCHFLWRAIGNFFKLP